MDVAANIHAPGDPAWAVWADELQARGDPRGELIALERVPKAQRSPAQLARLAALRQPFIEELDQQGRALLPGGWLAREAGSWRFGYALELRLGQAMAVPDPPSYSALFGCEALRGLSSLSLALAEEQIEPWLTALERHRVPLRRLTFYSRPGVHLDARACTRLWAALPTLRELTFSGSMHFAHLDHPRLRSVAMLGAAQGLQPQGFDLVARAQLPSLRRFVSVDDIHLFEHPQALEVLERLTVLEYPRLVGSTGYLEVLSCLRRCSIVALCPSERVDGIRSRLPHLNFDFIPIESERWEKLWQSPLSPARLERVMLSWSCGAPRVEISGGLYLAQELASRWVELDTQQRRGVVLLMQALDASRVGECFVFTRELAHEVMRGLEGSITRTQTVAALAQHQECCGEVYFVVEAPKPFP